MAKDGPRGLQVRVGHKTHNLVTGTVGTVTRVEPDEAESTARVLSDDEVVALGPGLGLRVEAHYGGPQDVEWALADGETYLIQSRPITTLTASGASATGAAIGAGQPLLRGLAASAGTATGRVRVLQPPQEGRKLERGEVLLAPMTNPDRVPTTRRAAAVVTDGGGMTCHTAIVSRELGVPCVVGARNPTSVLRDGELVTVDGAPGRGRRGRRQGGRGARDPASATPPPVEGVEPLATRI